MYRLNINATYIDCTTVDNMLQICSTIRYKYVDFNCIIITNGVNEKARTKYIQK